MKLIRKNYLIIITKIIEYSDTLIILLVLLSCINYRIKVKLPD